MYSTSLQSEFPVQSSVPVPSTVLVLAHAVFLGANLQVITMRSKHNDGSQMASRNRIMSLVTWTASIRGIEVSSKVGDKFVLESGNIR